MSRLVLFLSLYFCIYGSAHLYLLIKARRAFYLHGVHYFLLYAILTFLILAPINARLLEGQGHWLPAVIMAWIGFVWMGFIFIFVCLSLPLDGYHLLVSTGQHFLGTDWTAIMLSKRQCIGLVALITCAVMAYGAYEAHNIKTEKITIRSSKIPETNAPIRIVQISDAHMGLVFLPWRLAPMINAIQKAKPDMLVSTGDLVDGRLPNPAKLMNTFQSIHTPLGKYAVTGNHEYYTDLEQAADFTQKAGFTLLRNQSITVTKELVITGVDDPAGGHEENSPREAELLGRVPDTKFSLLLKHRPEIDSESRGKFDLQLSGHSHKGQIFPFEWVVRLSYPMGHGLRRLSSGGRIYISRGTGTWGPPIRVLAPPEITIIDLIPATINSKEESGSKLGNLYDANRNQVQRPLLGWRVDHLPYLFIHKCTDHNTTQSQGHTLKGDVLPGVPGFHVNVLFAPGAVFASHALVYRANGKNRRRSLHHFLPQRSLAKHSAPIPSCNAYQAMALGPIVVYVGGEICYFAGNQIDLQRIKRPGGRDRPETAVMGDALCSPQEL